MNPLLVVDGYNVIGAWKLAAQKKWSFDQCREELLHRLTEFIAYHGYEAVLVFDGTKSGRLMRSSETVGAVQVVYTRQGETADQYIERLCDMQPKYREIQVVTDDSVEQTIVLGRGAVRVPTRELLRDMAEAHAAQRERLSRTPIKKSTLISRLPEDQREILERMRRGQ